MSLVRLTKASFAQLEKSWALECERYNEVYVDYCSEQLNHARKICGETPPDERYGIFALNLDDGFEAIVHVNRANIPGPPGHTLRLVWVLFSPRFDFEDVSADIVAKMYSEIIFASIEMSKGNLNCKHLKIHLGNFSDRNYFAGVVSGLRMASQFSSVGLAGNWFQLSHA